MLEVRPTWVLKNERPYFALDDFEKRALREDLRAMKYLLERRGATEGGKPRRLGVTRLR